MSHILDHGQLTRVGGAKSFPVDVRVIAATSRDLGRMVKEGAFRAELYYRLREYPVTLPPLRDRPEEIPALAARFAGECARESGRPVPTLAEETAEYLKKTLLAGKPARAEAPDAAGGDAVRGCGPGGFPCAAAG